MELGEEDEARGGSDGGPEEPSAMEDRCVLAPCGLGWAAQGGPFCLVSQCSFLKARCVSHTGSQ